MSDFVCVKIGGFYSNMQKVDVLTTSNYKHNILALDYSKEGGYIRLHPATNTQSLCSATQEEVAPSNHSTAKPTRLPLNDPEELHQTKLYLLTDYRIVRLTP